jgi:hypothetical protein
MNKEQPVDELLNLAAIHALLQAGTGLWRPAGGDALISRLLRRCSDLDLVVLTAVFLTHRQLHVDTSRSN